MNEKIGDDFITTDVIEIDTRMAWILMTMQSVLKANKHSSIEELPGELKTVLKTHRYNDNDSDEFVKQFMQWFERHNPNKKLKTETHIRGRGIQEFERGNDAV